MATERLWAPAPCAPRRCSTSDTVPMRCTTTGSLFRKRPLRKCGSCPRSRLPWGWRGWWAPWAEGCQDQRSCVPHPLPCWLDPGQTQVPPATALPRLQPWPACLHWPCVPPHPGAWSHPGPNLQMRRRRPREVKSCAPNTRLGGTELGSDPCPGHSGVAGAHQPWAPRPYLLWVEEDVPQALQAQCPDLGAGVPEALGQQGQGLLL